MIGVTLEAVKTESLGASSSSSLREKPFNERILPGEYDFSNAKYDGGRDPLPCRFCFMENWSDDQVFGASLHGKTLFPIKFYLPR